MRARTSASQACGSTPFILAVMMRLYIAAARWPSYRVARLLKRVPARPLWRPLLKALACADALPVAPRGLALRLYRAALYAETV